MDFAREEIEKASSEFFKRVGLEPEDDLEENIQIGVNQDKARAKS